jgi:hypothetical protein
MNLKSKLNQLQKQAGSQASAPAPYLQQRTLKIPHRVGASAISSQHRNVSESTLAEHLKGELIADGLILIKNQIPLDSKLGCVELKDLQQYPHLPGDEKHQSIPNVYIDTETTGLSGGSGTLVFLIGYGRLGPSALHLSQLLMTRYSSESDMLEYFANAIRDDERLVSYNGKSYDIPLLRSRFRMQSLTHRFDQLRHLDLLHPTRCLFRTRWPDCRLSTLERRLLNYFRIDDLPGSEAPAAWFDYLKTGQVERLIKVAEHNRSDIVSLVVAHTLLTEATLDPDRYDIDLYSTARWIAKYDSMKACQLLQDRAAHLDERNKGFLAKLLQKRGDWNGATQIWKALAKSGCPDATERLAKYYEHIRKDILMAHHYCLLLPESHARLHRLRRLSRKVGIQ